MAADGSVRLSVASQFFHNGDADTLAAPGEVATEDSTSEKVRKCARIKWRPFWVTLACMYIFEINYINVHLSLTLILLTFNDQEII